MPGSIRDKISAFENLASSSLATSQLMPIVPPSPGFSYTKKMEKPGVRAKETSRIVPFEYKKKEKVEEIKEESREEKTILKEKGNSLEKDDAPRDTLLENMPEEDVGHEDTDSEINELGSEKVDDYITKPEDERGKINNNDDPSSDVSVLDSEKVDNIIEMANEETACAIQETVNDDQQDGIDDISFGEYVSAAADEELQCDSASIEDNTKDTNENVSTDYVKDHNRSTLSEPAIDSISNHVERKTLRRINESQGKQNDERDETEHLEKISQQHLAIFDEDTLEENQYHSEPVVIENDNGEMVDEDDLSDLVGVYIDDESIISDKQEGIVGHNQSSIRPKARHFHFDEALSTNHLSSIQEAVSELEQDDYGPRKIMTPTRQDTEEYYEDFGTRSNLSHNDDVVSQLTEGSFDMHRSHTGKKWRTSLDDHKPCSVSEHSSAVTYDLSNHEEENIMEPRHDSAPIFRQRNSLAYSQMRYGTDTEKIGVSESNISEITNPTYDKNGSSILNTISGSDLFEEKNIHHGCELEDVNSSKHKKRNDVAIIKVRRGRSKTPNENNNSSHSLNGNRQDRRFSIRSLSPFRRRKTDQTVSQNEQSSKIILKSKHGDEELQNDQKNDRAHKKSFSIRSLSPFRRMPTGEDNIRSRVNKSARKKSPFRRPMNTPSEIIQYEEESRNSIPLLAVSSNETSTTTEVKKGKFSFRSLSPFHREKRRSRRKARADPFDEGDGSV